MSEYRCTSSRHDTIMARDGWAAPRHFYGDRVNDQPPQDHTADEVWKPIPSTDGRYLASSFGRIMSRLNGRDRILRSCDTSSYGHQHLAVCPRPGVVKYRTVHLLVMEAFVGPRPAGLSIDHIDFDPRNNRPENLRYVSRKENTQHSVSAGRMTGDGKSYAKLTREAVLAIRQSRETQAVLAARYGVRQQAISKVKRGLRWGYVK